MKNLLIIAIVIMIGITIGNAFTTYQNGLDINSQLQRNYHIQQHLVMNDELLSASIKEEQKTNTQQNMLTAVINESLSGHWPPSCYTVPCSHGVKGNPLGLWVMVNESSPGMFSQKEAPPAEKIHVTLAIPGHVEFIDKHGDIIHLIR